MNQIRSMIDAQGLKETGGIRAVIFDMDGVLTDSEPLINAAAIAMFKEKGLVVQPEDFLPFVGTGEDRYIDGVAETHHIAHDLPAAKARTYEIYLDLVPKQLKAFPGAVELVRACRKAGLRVAVASSADRIKIEANLRQIGLPPQSWDAVVFGEEAQNKKPAPDLFLAAAAKLGLSPGQCVVVEDAINGIEAAKAAGIRCVAVAQTFPPDRLQQADLVRRNLLEVSVADLTGEASNCRDDADSPAVIESRPSTFDVRYSSQGGVWGFWATLGLTIVAMIAAVIAQFVALIIWLVATGGLRRGAFPQGASSNGLLLAMATWFAVPVVLGLVFLFARIRTGPDALHYLGFRPVRGRTLLRWSAALLILVVFSDALTVWLGKPISPQFMCDAYRTAGFLPIFWLALLVAAPLTEESLFRGFLFEGLLHSRLGAAGAVVLSAVAWAITHLQYDFYGIATIAVSGLLLGYVRLKSGSVYATLFLHGLMNLIATLEVALLSRGS